MTAITTICRAARLSFSNPTDAGRIGAYIGAGRALAAPGRENRVKMIAYVVLALTIVTASCAAFVADHEANEPVMAVSE